MGLRTTIEAVLKLPGEVRAERRGREQAWDYAQVNDAEVVAADPDYEEVRKAVALKHSDPECAFVLLLDLAERGSVWGMLNLAYAYWIGRGTPASPPDAERWYRQAFEAGSDRALLDYALVLCHRKALREAMDVYAVGVARDWAPAVCAYAELGMRQAGTANERLALKPLLDRAADCGSPAAQFLLAHHMLRGRFGVRYVTTGIKIAYRRIRADFADAT